MEERWSILLVGICHCNTETLVCSHHTNGLETALPFSMSDTCFKPGKEPEKLSVHLGRSRFVFGGFAVVNVGIVGFDISPL
jgi:hypothetical protein